MDAKRFNELYARANEKNYITFTDFLNLEEQSVLNNERLPHGEFGGYPHAERIVAAFGGDGEYPIDVVKISPAMQKFADKLSHRDFLGALMNLGIKRELLGDILIKDNEAYLFCLNGISEYICDNLDRVKHTTVRCAVIDALPDGAVTEPEESEINVSSQRADALIAAVYKLSRKACSELFAADRVFVNSRLCTNPSHTVKEGDIVSVRKFGRFQLCSQIRTTKKNREVLSVKIYK